jgi:hypothetical protein
MAPNYKACSAVLACARDSFRYLPISLLSGSASPPSGLGHSTVWRRYVLVAPAERPAGKSQTAHSSGNDMLNG